MKPITTTLHEAHGEFAAFLHGLRADAIKCLQKCLQKWIACKTKRLHGRYAETVDPCQAGIADVVCVRGFRRCARASVAARRARADGIAATPVVGAHLLFALRAQRVPPCPELAFA